MGKKKGKGASARELFHKTERRRSLILTIREHPDWSHAEIAKHLGVDRSTITRDLNEITTDLQRMNTEAFQVHWQRLLLEIQSNKQLCMQMLDQARAHRQGAGSRWMEEMSKIMMLEIKLLGLDKFDPNLKADRKPFDKTQRDAVIDAAMRGYEMGQKASIDTKKMLLNPQAENSVPHPPPRNLSTSPSRTWTR